MTNRLNLITVLMTSVGNDGFPAVLQAVKSNQQREIRIIGVDTRPSAPGIYMVDQGYLVPPRSKPERLIECLFEICNKENVNVIYPLSTEDQEFYSSLQTYFRSKDIVVATSPLNSLQIANDKPKLYKFARTQGIPCPDFEAVRNWEELQQAVSRLGFPDHPFVLKLNRGTGAQGLKIVHQSLDVCQRLLDRDNRIVAFSEIENWLKSLPSWPPLHVTAFLPGNEYSVDVLCNHGKILSSVTRLRLSTYYGLALHAQTVQEPDVQELACGLVTQLGLCFVVNVQIRRAADGTAMLMEVNPRIPGTIGLTVAAGINMPYLALAMALGETFEIPQPQIGMTILRYWEAVYLPKQQMLQ